MKEDAYKEELTRYWRHVWTLKELKLFLTECEIGNN